MTTKTRSKARNLLLTALLLTLGILSSSSSAFAACSSPTGNEGDIVYSSTYHVMQYCNSVNWISMGSNSTTSFGTLTAGDFCTATSGTAISCTVPSINLTSQVTGALPVANGGTGAVTFNAHGVVLGEGTGAQSTTAAGTSGQLLIGQSGTTDPIFYSMSGDCTITNGGVITCTKSNGSSFGSLATASSVNLATMVSGGLPIANGGTNATSQTTNGVTYFNGTNITSGSGLVYNGTQLGIGTATPTSALTVNGTHAFQLASDYTTTGSQSDVALNTASAIRYSGSGVATFYGIAAGAAGQVIYLHNASTSTLTLSNQSASDSTAASRIITGTGADLAMAANSSVILQYDNTAARWRVIGGSGGSGGSSTLAGLSDATITSPASGNLLTYNGSKWVNSTVSSAVSAAVAPSFSVNKSGTNQTVTTNVGTKLTFGTVAFDTNNNYSTGTSRYTPTIAGKYMVTINAYCSDATQFCLVYLYKNGSSVAESGGYIGSSLQIGMVTYIVDMNGTTDYLEAYVDNGGGTTINGSTQLTYFTGALLAPLASGSVAGTGTANYLPKWSSSTNLTSGLLYDNGTSIGLGTTVMSASNKFEIGGNASIGYTNTAAPTNGLIISGQTGIGTTTPNSAAALDITSTTTGLLPPRMTTTQMNAISSPPAGLTIYNTTANSLYTYNGSSWAAGGSGGGGGSSSGGGQLLGIYSSSTAVTNNSIVLTGASNSSPSLSGTTLTLPSNTSYIVVETWGGGGGGGNDASGSNGGGGGGGGGSYALKVINSPSGTYYYTIGSAGSGAGASSNANGTSGGATCFGTNSTACTSSIINASGGVYGTGSTSGGGGSGGTATGGDINIAGSAGGSSGTTNTYTAGNGGSAPLGGGGGTKSAAGASFGGGGGGSYNAGAAGAGGTGGIKISVYASGVTSGSIGTGATGNVAYYNAAGSAISPSTTMTISGSNIGIGTATPSYPLDVVGQARFTGGYTTSDRRWKTNIQPLVGALDSVTNLQGVTFDWRRDEFPQMKFSPGRQIGFIAQDVEKVLPELVSTDNNGFKSVAYESFAPILVEAVKQIKSLFQADHDEIAVLKKQNADLLARYQKDEKTIDELKAANDNALAQIESINKKVKDLQVKRERGDAATK